MKTKVKFKNTKVDLWPIRKWFRFAYLSEDIIRKKDGAKVGRAFFLILGPLDLIRSYYYVYTE